MIYSMTGYGTSSSGIGKNKINAELKALNGKFFELKIRGLDINFNLSKTIKDYLFKTLNRGSVYLYLESSKISSLDNISLNSAKFELLNDIVDQVNKKYKKSLNLNHLLRINDFISISSSFSFSRPEVKLVSSVSSLREAEDICSSSSRSDKLICPNN